MEVEKDTYPRINYVSTIASQYLAPSVNLGNMSSIKIHRDLVAVTEPYDILKSMGLKGIYSYRKDKNYVENELYFLINPNKFIYDRWFYMLEEYLRTVVIKLKNEDYIPFLGSEEVDKGVFIYTMIIHPRWKGIKTLINSGRFSMVNTLYPNYVDYFNNNGYKTKAWRIIMKDKKLKQEMEDDLDVIIDSWAELAEIPDREKETCPF